MSVIRVIDASEGIDFVGSRQIGEAVRERIEQDLEKGVDRITIDFAGVRSITQSFADEVIGILIRKFGSDYVRSRVFIVNHNEDIRATLNFVAAYSKRKTA
ncbi:STAS-like domain-containing protein [Hydrogenimonas sp.]